MINCCNVVYKNGGYEVYIAFFKSITDDAQQILAKAIIRYNLDVEESNVKNTFILRNKSHESDNKRIKFTKAIDEIVDELNAIL